VDRAVRCAALYTAMAFRAAAADSTAEGVTGAIGRL